MSSPTPSSPTPPTDTSCSTIFQVLFFYTVGCTYCSCSRARKKASALTRKQYIPYWTHEVVIGRSPNGLRELWSGWAGGDSEGGGRMEGNGGGCIGSVEAGRQESEESVVTAVTVEEIVGEKMIYARQDGCEEEGWHGAVGLTEEKPRTPGGVFGWPGRRKQKGHVVGGGSLEQTIISSPPISSEVPPLRQRDEQQPSPAHITAPVVPEKVYDPNNNNESTVIHNATSASPCASRSASPSGPSGAASPTPHARAPTPRPRRSSTLHSRPGNHNHHHYDSSPVILNTAHLLKSPSAAREWMFLPPPSPAHMAEISRGEGTWMVGTGGTGTPQTQVSLSQKQRRQMAKRREKMTRERKCGKEDDELALEVGVYKVERGGATGSSTAVAAAAAAGERRESAAGPAAVVGCCDGGNAGITGRKERAGTMTVTEAETEGTGLGTAVLRSEDVATAAVEEDQTHASVACPHSSPDTAADTATNVPAITSLKPKEKKERGKEEVI